MSTQKTDPLAPIDAAFEQVQTPREPVARSGRRITVCPAAELLPGDKRIVDVPDGPSIGVFNLNGSYHAIKNVCPHNGAPLCLGTVHATHAPSEVLGEFAPCLDGRVLRCPWHGWEFDIVSGKGLYDRNSRVATYVVEVEEGVVTLVL